MSKRPLEIPAAPTSEVQDWDSENNPSPQSEHRRLAVVDSTKETLILLDPVTGTQYELMRADADNAGGASGSTTTDTHTLTIANGIITAIDAL